MSSSSSSSLEPLTAACGSGTRRTDRHRPQAGGTTSRLAPPTPRPRACVTLRVTHRVGSGGDALHAFLALECTRLLCQPMRPSLSRPCPLARSESVASGDPVCPCPAPPAARRRLLLASQSRGALPCLALFLLFSAFFFSRRRTKRPRVRIGYRSPAAAALSCVCPILLVSSGSGASGHAVFLFFFGSLRPKWVPSDWIQIEAATIFLRLALRFPVLPSHGDDRQTPHVSARCHRSVPFLHNNPVRAAFSSRFGRTEDDGPSSRPPGPARWHCSSARVQLVRSPRLQVDNQCVLCGLEFELEPATTVPRAAGGTGDR